ncbi:MAG: hypothetical protein KatS3mg060_1121 [Dehalococcoidia bacterium]|nr:MAG: hypothetical protein KatS3mg060_1121 [Dehalococcoidia bacterium]
MIETLDELRTADAPGQPFRIRLTEAEAIEVVTRQAGRGAPLPIGDISLELRPEQIALALDVTLVGMTMTVQVRGIPRIDADRVSFEFHEMRLNGAPAPAFIQQQVIQRVNERLAPDELPIVIESLELGEGWVLLAGRTK